MPKRDRPSASEIQADGPDPQATVFRCDPYGESRYFGPDHRFGYCHWCYAHRVFVGATEVYASRVG